VHRIVIRIENPEKRCISLELGIKYSSIPRSKHAANDSHQAIPGLNYNCPSIPAAEHELPRGMQAIRKQENRARDSDT
jgi:hypothetical protein